MTSRQGDPPILPADRAFAVQFTAGATDDRWFGRVEHVVSGRGAWFVSADELSRFIRDVLRGVAERAPGASDA